MEEAVVEAVEEAVEGVRNRTTSFRPSRFIRVSLPVLLDVKFTRFFNA